MRGGLYQLSYLTKAGVEGFEPPASRFRVWRSTTELHPCVAPTDTLAENKDTGNI